MNHLDKNFKQENRYMGLGRMALLWILGVPVGVIAILKLLGLI
ncbi:hypothetical protein DB44_AL00070 [Candidatus Protochlamydia amoebophila]|uniref:Uncharacterized protein n=1 Tax=Candidatus Protochlamydia amoebophila TaxID=362787 RepID=A0A0C1HIA5_9BACT|nr:hypothetical protein DB44_AL00070 [Candidatus Protochlamydia amoebophila]